MPSKYYQKMESKVYCNMKKFQLYYKNMSITISLYSIELITIFIKIYRENNSTCVL